MGFRFTSALFALAVAPAACSADAIRLTNGDTLNGTVVSLNENSLVLKSANFGELTIPREKVALIGLGDNGLNVLNAAEAAPAPVPEDSPAEWLVPSLQSPQIQGQLKQLFGEALGGKSISEMQDDIRAARRQLKSLQDDLGEGPEAKALDSYLRLFDQFAPPEPSSEPQNESAPEGGSTK